MDSCKIHFVNEIVGTATAYAQNNLVVDEHKFLKHEVTSDAGDTSLGGTHCIEQFNVNYNKDFIVNKHALVRATSEHVKRKLSSSSVAKRSRPMWTTCGKTCTIRGTRTNTNTLENDIDFHTSITVQRFEVLENMLFCTVIGFAEDESYFGSRDLTAFFLSGGMDCVHAPHK
uniref:Uncharacterized protein n=1 Tax=Glossina pallidipes TaxID=7398 RepID=A0A1A9Z7T0_GLOPL